MLKNFFKRFVDSVNSRHAVDALPELEKPERFEEFEDNEKTLEEVIRFLYENDVRNIPYLELRSWEIHTNTKSLSDLVQAVIYTRNSIKTKSPITQFLQKYKEENISVFDWLYGGNPNANLNNIKNFILKELVELKVTLDNSTMYDSSKRRFCQIVLVDLVELVKIMEEFSEDD